MEARNRNIADLLDKPRYSDFEIVCEKHVFQVHRSVVCLCSKVLERECDGKFKEAGIRKVEHIVFDRFAVDRMLQFMYLGDYQLLDSTHGSDIVDEEDTAAGSHDHEDNTDGENTVEDPIVSHVYVYAIADYYEVPGLQALAIKKITEEREARRRDFTTDQVLHIATVLYANTTKSAADLRGELLSLAYDIPDATIDSADFMKAIAEQPALQEFASELLSETVKRQRAYVEGLNDTVHAHSIRLTDLTARVSREEQKSSSRKDQLAVAEKKLQDIDYVINLQQCDACTNPARGIETPRPFSYALVKVGEGYGAKCHGCDKVLQRPAQQRFRYFENPFSAFS